MSFLLMYGAMWIFNVRFDVRFFAVAHSLLGHTGLFVLDSFTESVRNLAKYMAAQKRIQVCVFEWKKEESSLLFISDVSDVRRISKRSSIVIGIKQRSWDEWTSNT